MDQIQDVALDVYEALDTPVSLSCAILLRNGMTRELSAKKLNPLSYISAESFARDAQAVAFLGKLESSENADELVDNCKKEFYSSEKHCFETNQRMKFYSLMEQYPLDSDTSDDKAVVLLLRTIRKKVRHLIGRAPSVDEIEGRFGPGTTFGLTTADSSILHKLVTAPELTEHASDYLSSLDGSAWMRYLASDTFFKNSCPSKRMDVVLRDETEMGSPRLPVVRGNRWTSVPKSSLKRRGIRIEPGLNIWLQLGVGSILKKRLRKAGLLLIPRSEEIFPGLERSLGIDSQEIHKSWAREASITDEYATLDLSSASDHIATEFVRNVLPADWFKLLSDLRSPVSYIDGSPCILEGFSSMGNGFTFELETLLFYAVCGAVGELLGSSGAHTVYGDDIIVPREWASTVCSALRVCGLKINVDKSFQSGDFRESCGGDYFMGVDVRPVSIRKKPADPYDWMIFHNLVYRVHRSGRTVKSLEMTLQRIRSYVPYAYRKCRGSWKYGDVCFHGGRPKIRLHRKNPNSLQFLTLVPQTQTIPLNRVDPLAQLLAALYGLPSSGCPVRERAGYRTNWSPYFGI